MTKQVDPNSRWNRTKRFFRSRWWRKEFEQAEECFQLSLLGKDVGYFLLTPTVTLLLYKGGCAAISHSKKKASSPQEKRSSILSEPSKSQIIEFGSKGRGSGMLHGRRSPGALIKVRLLNVVETYSNAPVHAQILDEGLGKRYMGGTLIGDATSDGTFDRININFRFVRDPNREGIAFPISARALGLDGTLGLNAKKKEGFFARAAIGSANESSHDMQSKGSDTDFKQVLFRALTVGLVKEFGSESEVANNRAQVLSLSPSTVFFVELTDFFPRSSQ